MDKRKGMLNIAVSLVFKVFLLVGSIIVKRFVIIHLGNDINGLNALYLSIVGMLTVAELGVGEAITFCMYRPIVEGDKDKVAALYRLLTKIYLAVFAVIIVSGICVMPFLKNLAKGYANTENLYVTYSIMLLSCALTYLFGAKTSLINAYKNNYITTAIFSSGTLLQYLLQILAILLTNSFQAYLWCRVIAAAAQWIATEAAVRKNYADIIFNRQTADKETQNQVLKNTTALFMHRIGTVLVSTADSTIISAYIGIEILGKYSNYTTVMSSMTQVLMLCFMPLTSVIGQACVSKHPKQINTYFNFFHGFNYLLGMVFFLGYYAVIDSVITILFGAGLELDRFTILIIVINYFIQFMRRSVLLFRDSSGTFYNDRWKPLFEGIVNIVLSIWFVNVFGIAGVLIATIITNLTICGVVEPFVLHKHVFQSSSKRFYIKNYCYIAAFVVMLYMYDAVRLEIDNVWASLLANGMLSVVISSVGSAVILAFNRDFMYHAKKLTAVFRRK